MPVNDSQQVVDNAFGPPAANVTARTACGGDIAYNEFMVLVRGGAPPHGRSAWGERGTKVTNPWLT